VNVTRARRKIRASLAESTLREAPRVLDSLLRLAWFTPEKSPSDDELRA